MKWLFNYLELSYAFENIKQLLTINLAVIDNKIEANDNISRNK